MFLTTFQGTFSSFMAVSVLNKEEIASLQRLLEAQERKEKEKNNHQLAPWRRKAAQWRRTLWSLRSGARELAPWRRREEKPYKFRFNSEKGLQNFTAEELFFRSDSEVLQRYLKCGNSFQPCL
ncbi:hypothetical protein QL285_056675 [Trifolium repens]|nr:hypothetical protein QL285_056675 [Trifolium repens]